VTATSESDYQADSVRCAMAGTEVPPCARNAPHGAPHMRASSVTRTRCSIAGDRSIDAMRTACRGCREMCVSAAIRASGTPRRISSDACGSRSGSEARRGQAGPRSLTTSAGCLPIMRKTSVHASRTRRRLDRLINPGFSPHPSTCSTRDKVDEARSDRAVCVSTAAKW